MKRILLMGNPNVGKSVIFSRLTGAHAVASNYPGTTVEFTQGMLPLPAGPAEVIDVPGTYTLEPTCVAEEVAVEMLPEGDVIVNVVDATNLERNLYLTLQLLERGRPLIVVLNLWDDAQRQGLEIDVEQLQARLGVPVIPTVAVTGEGIEELVSLLPEAQPGTRASGPSHERWADVEKILAAVQHRPPSRPTWLEAAQDACIHPGWGVLIAVAVIFLSFQVVRCIGEGLIDHLLDPLFQTWYRPLIVQLSVALGGSGFLHDLLIGKLIEGEIDFRQSFGLLTTGVYTPLALVLPYVFSFYLVLGFLEDLGYLPRLAVLMDNILRRVGLHGYAVIPMILGLGCNVPGALATRILESQRERFIAATLMAIGVPCMAQNAIIIKLVGEHGFRNVALVFATLFVVWLALGTLLHRVLKGKSPELLIELPRFHLPPWGALFRKLGMRLRGFLQEAVPYFLAGVLFANVLYASHLIDLIGKLAAPVVTGLWGLPEEAVSALVIGFLRKDVAVGMLDPLNLTAPQLVVGCTVLALYFPCIATFVVLLRELGFKDLGRSVLIMLFTALVVGTLLNWML